MNSPARPYWTPLRIALWGAAALFVATVFGPRFVQAFRPPDGRLQDFVQEWLSARNYLAGTPVYADQTESLFRHTGLTPTPQRGEEMLPWNAHPPAAVALALPLGRLSYQDAHLVWNLLTFPLFLLSLWVIARELKVPLAPWSVLPAVALLGVFHPLYAQLVEGQLNALILFLLTVAWAADRRERTGWAGAAVGLAAGLKLFPGLLFAYFLFAGRWRALATGAAVGAGVNVLALTLLGWGELRIYVEQVIPSLSVYRSARDNVSLTGFWVRLFDPHPRYNLVPLSASPVAAAALGAASQALAVGAVCWAAWRARTAAGRNRAFAASVVAMLLVSPVAWTHYFLLLALPVGVLWAGLPGGPLRWALWVVVIPLWLPKAVLYAPALGLTAARKVMSDEPTLTAVDNLAALSVYNYLVVALFALVLLAPTGTRAAEQNPEPGPPPPDPDEERLDRRLFGPTGG